MYYILNYYWYSIMSLSALTMLYFPLHIIITSFLANHFRVHGFVTKIRELAKPILCASLQSVAILSMFGVFVARSLQGMNFSSYPLIIDEVILLLIIIFSIVYSRFVLRGIYSWLSGIALFVFSTPPLSQMLSLLSLYAIINPFGFFTSPIRDWGHALHPLLITVAIITLFSIVQMISLKKISRSTLNGKKVYSLFALLFVSNLTAMFSIKYLAKSIQRYEENKQYIKLRQQGEKLD